MRQMRCLTEYQELVEGIYTQIGYQFQSDREPNTAEIAHHLVEREASRVTQSSVRSPELVFDNITRVSKQYFSCFFLAFDDVGYHSRQVIQQLAFASAKRGLVRDLEEISDNFASLSIKAAIGQTDLLKSGKNLCDLFRKNESRKMDQHRSSQAGSCIRRTGGEETEFIMERVRHAAAELRFQRVDRVEGIGNAES